MHRTPGFLLLAALLAAILTGSATELVRASGQDVADEVFYHYMPIAWRDSNNDASRFGDFDGMTASLGYLDSLGVTAIWMNPVHPSPAYHGYQHGRADSLNPRFGSEAEFIAFIQAAHARGIKVFVDIVAYGISHDSPWFQDAYGNPASVYDDWLAFENGSNTSYLGATFPTWDGATVGFIHWDHRDANPTALVRGWLQKWLDPNGDGNFSDGVDGYRFDHVWETYPNGPGGYGYHIDTFWAPMRDSLRAVNPDVFLFAEQADWGIHGQQLFVGLDAAFTKPFLFAARNALASEDSGPVRGQMLSTLAALGVAPAPGTFLAAINDHDIDRLGSAVGSNLNKLKAGAAVLLTQSFPPVIYYGDEIGMLGSKNPGYTGDAADIPMREPFKWNAVAGPPMSNYHVLNGPAFSGSISQDNDGRSVEEQTGVPGSLLETYRALIAARTGSVALRRGDYLEVSNARSEVWTFVRDHADQQVLVAINLSGSTVNDDLDLSGYGIPGGSTTPVDLVTGASLPPLTTANRAAYPVSLGAYAFHVLDVDVEAPVPPVTTLNGIDIPADHPGGSIAVQNNATGYGDNVSELNQLFVRTTDDTLFVGIPGNLAPDGTGFALLLDTGPGGQNVLDLSDVSPPPYGPDGYTGTELDAGFAPDHLIFLNAFGATFWVDQYELLTAGGTDKTYRGQGVVNSGTGTLSGGTNPNGMAIALDNTNTAGVTGSDPSGATTATTGFEFAIPFADIGVATPASGTLGIAAFLNDLSGSIGNQWLPGLGGGSGALGIAPDLTGIPGDQFVTISMPFTSVGTPDTLPDGLRLSAAYLDRTRSRVRFSVELPEPGPVDLTVFDVRGRLVRRVAGGELPAGVHTFDWQGATDAGRQAPGGVYYAKLDWRFAERTVRVVLLP